MTFKNIPKKQTNASSQVLLVEDDDPLLRFLKEAGDSFLVVNPDWQLCLEYQQEPLPIQLNHHQTLGQKIWDHWPQLAGTPLEEKLRDAMTNQAQARIAVQEAQTHRKFLVHIFPVPTGIIVFSLEVTDLTGSGRPLPSSGAAVSTERTEMEEEIRRLNEELERRVWERTQEIADIQNRLMDSVESERARLSRELHDGPMQDLYAIAYSFAADDPETITAQQMQSIQQEIFRINQSLRNICRDLRPPTLSTFGVAKAIAEHVSRYEEGCPNLQMRVNLIEERLEIPERSKLALFRIFQVAFGNALRHAQANHLEINMALEDTMIVLEIKDDGVGFEVPKRWNKFARVGHLGLAGANERAEAAGGTLEVQSAPGRGTTVKVRIPRTPPSDEAGR